MKLREELRKINRAEERIFDENGEQKWLEVHEDDLLALFESTMLDEVIGEDEIPGITVRVRQGKVARQLNNYDRNDLKEQLRKKVKEMTK